MPTQTLDWFSLKQKLFPILFGIFFLVLPTGNKVLGGYSLLAILIASVLLLWPKDWLNGLKSPIWWTTLAFFLIYVVSLYWSDDTAYGARKLETKMSLAFIPLFFMSSIRYISTKSKFNIAKCFVLGNVAVITTAFGIAIWDTIQSGSSKVLTPSGLSSVSRFTYETLSSPFMHPGYLATYVGLGLLTSIYILLNTNAKKKWLWGVVGAYLFFGMVMLQGRVNLLALLLTVGGATLVYVIKTKKYKLLFVPVVPVVLVALFALFGPKNLKERYLQFPNFEYDISGTNFNSATYRLAEWHCAGQLIGDHFWLGSGVGDAMEELLDYYQKEAFHEGLKNRYNTHNQYIETWIATGFFGFAILIFMLVVFAIKMLQQKQFWLLACLAFFALCMLTESMFERASCVILFVTFFPFFFDGRELNKEKE